MHTPYAAPMHTRHDCGPGVGRSGTAAEYAARIPAIRAAVRSLQGSLREALDDNDPQQHVIRVQLLSELSRLAWYEARATRGTTRPRRGTNLAPHSLRPVGHPRKRAALHADRP